MTLRLAYLACDHFNADTGLAMVRTDHQAFYHRVFLHETISEPRSFPGWHSKKVVLMASDFRKLRERVLARFPIMRSTLSRTEYAVPSQQRPAAAGGEVAESPPCRPLSRRPLKATIRHAAWPESVRSQTGSAHVNLARFSPIPGFCGQIQCGGSKARIIDAARSSGRAAIALRNRDTPPIALKSRYIWVKRLAFTLVPHLQPINHPVAFRRLGAFERVWQHPIKVDGTFA